MIPIKRLEFGPSPKYLPTQIGTRRPLGGDLPKTSHYDKHTRNPSTGWGMELSGLYIPDDRKNQGYLDLRDQTKGRRSLFQAE